MTRRLSSLLLLVLLCLLGCGQAPAQGTADQAGLPPIQVYFSPKGGCTEAVVKELGNAKSRVLVQAYSFTNAPIAKALFQAHKRGVKVEVILDKSQRTEKYSEADFLSQHGHARANRREAADRPQQGHGHRRRDGHHWQLQLHHGRRREERRESAGDPQSRTWLPSTRPTGRPTPHIRTLTKPRRRATPKRTMPPQSREDRRRHPPIAGGFVASARSQVFHRADCKSAGKISAKNLVHYATRDEAIQAGKKPCAECQP